MLVPKTVAVVWAKDARASVITAITSEALASERARPVRIGRDEKGLSCGYAKEKKIGGGTDAPFTRVIPKQSAEWISHSAKIRRSVTPKASGAHEDVMGQPVLPRAERTPRNERKR